VTEAKPLVGEAMLIDKMFLGTQDHIIIQEFIQDVEGFTNRAGNDLRMKHAMLIGGMCVHGQRPVVVPEVARIERAKEGARLKAEALSIGRRHGAIPPHGAER
jgi:hypothetical protein